MYWLRKFDLSGICMMIACGDTPFVYYGFMCEEDQFTGILFLSQVWIFCIVALFVTMLGSGDGTGWFTRHRKCIAAISYLIAGYSCAPGFLYLKYYSNTYHCYDVWTTLGGGILYAIGAITYALKFPERFFPGIFDIWGNSH